MARITVEDCLEHVENRFSLVLIAAQRTKQLMRGEQPRVLGDTGNKEVVLALREIAEGLVKYHEKDPVEVPEDVAAAEVRKAVAARQALLEREEAMRPSQPQPVIPDTDDDEFEDSEIDGFEDEFADDDEED